LPSHLVYLLAFSATLLAAPAVAQTKNAPADHPVIELRQYKLTPGYQDRFIPLFDERFVDSQEALGIRLIGHFHDHDRRDRFTWIREFPSMAARANMLQSFYFGPVWKEYKGIANPMLDDNDNVLLLRPARTGSGFGPSALHPTGKAPPSHTNTIFAVIEYVWKDPNEGFADFFLDHVAPQLNAAGLPVLGVYVPEEQPNNFPRLPVRPDKKILVWFTKAPHPGDFEETLKRVASSANWQKEIAGTLNDAEERPRQVLRLDPNPRSALR
jgi:hypothetical protein